MSASITVLVTGATGSQGGAVARKLLERGHRVRALTRSADSAAARELERLGAEVVIGNFDDADSLERTARGAGAAFVMATPFEAGIEAEVRQGTNAFEAAKAAGVGHIVYSSVASADEDTDIPHFDSKAELERRLADLGVPYTIVAPVAFMENLLAPWAVPALQQGTLAVALPPSRPMQQVALTDLASFVVQVIEERERFLGQRVEIASDEVTGAEQAELLSQVLGREIRYVEQPIDEVRSFNEDAALMFEWLARTGYSVDIVALHRSDPEAKWQSFEEWARDRDWSALTEQAA